MRSFSSLSRIASVAAFAAAFTSPGLARPPGDIFSLMTGAPYRGGSGKRKKKNRRANRLRAHSRHAFRVNKYVADAHFDSTGNAKRLAPALGTSKHGATGQKYISYAEYDRLTRIELRRRAGLLPKAGE